MTDHTPRTILVIGTLATVLSTLGACRAHADDATRLDRNGKPCPVATAPAPQGLTPLTFCSPALPASTYMHPAYPEARPLPSHGGGAYSTSGSVHTSHGTVHFQATTK